MSPARHSLRAALDLFFPRHCVATGEAVEDNSPLAFLCAEEAACLPRITGPACARCGYPLEGAGEEGAGGCAKCRALEPVAFDHGKGVLRYEGGAHALVHALKYARGRYLRTDFVRLARECPGLAEFLEDAVLVPVPLFPRRERERGFNQSACLARWLVALGRNARVRNLLRRAVDTPTQVGLSPAERLRNVQNAFALRGRGRLSSSSSYILVDDICTTGATLNACARVLKKNGAGRVGLLAFCHA